VEAKGTDAFRDRNLSANYSCGLLRLRLESDWSQNNQHSRNNFRRSWFYGFHCNLFLWKAPTEAMANIKLDKNVIVCFRFTVAGESHLLVVLQFSFFLP